MDPSVDINNLSAWNPKKKKNQQTNMKTRFAKRQGNAKGNAA